MYYHRLSITGFGPHTKETVYNFSSGLMFITGKNGSGKSTIFDAIQWCLFGPQGSTRSLKDRTSIINNSMNSATVKLSLSHEVEGEVTITRKLTRSGKHTVDIVVNDVNLGGGIRDSQAYISKLCGDMRHDVFSSVYLLMSSPLTPPSSFLGATPSVRRDILSRVVDPLENFASAYKTISKALTEEKKELASLEAKRDTTKEIKSSVIIPDPPEVSSSQWAEKLSIAQSAGMSDRQSLQRRMSNLEDKLSSIQKREEELNERIEKFHEEKESIEKDMRQKKSLILNLRKKHDAAKAKNTVAEFIISECNRQLEASDAVFHGSESELRGIDFRLSIVDKHTGSETCPVCHSPFDSHSMSDSLHAQHEDVLSRHNSIESQRESWNNTIEFLSTTCGAKSVDDLENQVESMESKWYTSRDRRRGIVQSIHNLSEELSELKEDAKEYQRELSEAEDALAGDSQDDSMNADDIYRKKVQAQSVEEEISRQRTYCAELDEKIEQLSGEVDNAAKRVEQLSRLRHQTSPNGDLSDSIARLMEDIGKKSTELYDELFGTTSDITITDGEEDGVKTCIVESNGRDVATYSHGEQLRIYACLQAAFSCVVYGRTGMWIPLMWDEPSLAVDSDVVEKIFSLPGKVTPEYHQSFIITRDDSINVDSDEVICLD